MYSLIYFLKHLSSVLSELWLTNVPSKMLSNTLFKLNYCLLYVWPKLLFHILSKLYVVYCLNYRLIYWLNNCSMYCLNSFLMHCLNYCQIYGLNLCLMSKIFVKPNYLFLSWFILIYVRKPWSNPWIIIILKIHEKIFNILVQVHRKQGEELQYLHDSKGWLLDQKRQPLN